MLYRINETLNLKIILNAETKYFKKFIFVALPKNAMKIFLFFILLPMLVISQDTLSGVEELLNQKQYRSAEHIAKAYLKNNPNQLKAMELLGDAHGYQAHWDDAIVMYKALVNAKPNNANYQYKYGGAMGMKALENKFKAVGFIGDIKAAFTKAAELDKNHVEVRWALVEFYMQLPGIFGGSKEKSLKYAEELETLSKVDGYLAKGYIYEYDNEEALAETYYKKAINLGGSLTCYDKLATFYENKKKPKNALQTIEEAQKKHNRNALHYQIGKVAAEYNIELDKGEKCLYTYLTNYSAKDGVPKAWAHYRLAQIHTYRHNKAKALQHINLALEELPKIKPFKLQKEKILQL